MTTSNTTARLREEYNVERDRTGERSYFRDLFQATQGGDVNALGLGSSSSRPRNAPSRRPVSPGSSCRSTSSTRPR